MLFTFDSLWEYQTTANTVPADPEAVTVPAAGWSAPAPGPFGTVGVEYPAFSGYYFDQPIATAWAPGTGLWIRRNVALDGTNDLIIQGRCENALFIYVDGVFAGSINKLNDQRLMQATWHVVIPRAVIPAGTHQVAVLCLDEDPDVDGSTYVYVEAQYVPPMLTLQPSAPAVESLEWATDVANSKNGTESRLELRFNPRQRFKFNYPARLDQQGEAYNAIFSAREKDWLLPVWTQAQRLGAVAAGETVLTIDTGIYELRNNGLAMLWQSSTEFQLVGIDRVDDGSMRLSSVTNNFMDAWLVPVYSAYIASNPRKRLNGNNTEYEINWQVTDVPYPWLALVPDAPEQYQGNDIYFDESLLDGDSLSDDIVTQLDIMDEDLGLLAKYAPWLSNRAAHTHQIITETRQEAWDLRVWIYRRAGKYRSFWQPSFEGDLHPIAVGSSALTVRSDEYQRYGEVRRHIAVETRNGWTVAEINSSTQLSATQVRLELNTNLGIAVSDILRVCWLGLKRLNTDSVNIEWIGNGVCQMSVRLLEFQT